MIRLFSFFVNLFFPARCMFCREYLPYDADKPFCDGCRAAFTGVVPRKTPIPAGVCFYALDYEADVRRALIAYKFHNKPQYARALGELLVPLIAPLGHVDALPGRRSARCVFPGVVTTRAGCLPKPQGMR